MRNAKEVEERAKQIYKSLEEQRSAHSGEAHRREEGRR
jgi:hypothetical protein